LQQQAAFRIFRNVTSSALTRPSESATRVYMVSYHADPSLMTAQRECRHVKHILKQIYTSHHPMMIHLLASFCSSPPMAWSIILCMQEEGWRTGELPRGGVILIASVKRRPWQADPAAIVKKRMSISPDSWIGGFDAATLIPDAWPTVIIRQRYIGRREAVGTA
jgi:hypothetical protein